LGKSADSRSASDASFVFLVPLPVPVVVLVVGWMCWALWFQMTRRRRQRWKNNKKQRYDL
jgi:hypothetical protein